MNGASAASARFAHALAHLLAMVPKVPQSLIGLPYDRFFCLRSTPMPTYHIEMMEGRTVEQKKKLVEEITRVSVEVLGGTPEMVDILITDVKRENWATGGKLWLERTS